MKNLAAFDIPFAGLSMGMHQFDYELDESFFKEFEETGYKRVRIHVDLDFNKSKSVFTLSFKFSGYINKECDRCLDQVKVGINENHVMLVRLDDDPGLDDQIDDIIVLGRTNFKLNIAQHLYDYVSLKLPMRSVHKDGECNPEIDKIINREADNKLTLDDPRWNKLKDISQKNN